MPPSPALGVLVTAVGKHPCLDLSVSKRQQEQKDFVIVFHVHAIYDVSSVVSVRNL